MSLMFFDFSIVIWILSILSLFIRMKSRFKHKKLQMCTKSAIDQCFENASYCVDDSWQIYCTWM